MKVNMQLVKAVGHKIAGTKIGLRVAKHSPEILMTLGVAGVVTGTVLACKNTLKVPDLIHQHEDDILQIKHTHNMMGTDKEPEYGYSYRKEISTRYIKTGLELAKLYSPAISIGATGICCVLGSHGILKKRNLALTAAYNLVSGHFNEYRDRVREDLGVEKDRYFLGGEKEMEFEYDNSDPKSRRKKQIVKTVGLDPNKMSQYARYFDDASREWQTTPEYNLMYLKSQQSYFNNMLHARGHVFLNEVYDALDIPRSKEGAVVGWALSDNGDNFIDFGFMNPENPNAMDFINGYNNSVLLDFNVDGVIYDLI